jgi:Cro/C1-type HTH DNA-binding domain
MTAVLDAELEECRSQFCEVGSGLWSGQPNTVKLDELDVVCAVLGCEVGELLLPEPVAVPEPAASQSTGAVAEARGVTPRSRTGRSLPPR